MFIPVHNILDGRMGVWGECIILIIKHKNFGFRVFEGNDSFICSRGNAQVDATGSFCFEDRFERFLNCACELGQVSKHINPRFSYISGFILGQVDRFPDLFRKSHPLIIDCSNRPDKPSKANVRKNIRASFRWVINSYHRMFYDWSIINPIQSS